MLPACTLMKFWPLSSERLINKIKARATALLFLPVRGAGLRFSADQAPAAYAEYCKVFAQEGISHYLRGEFLPIGDKAHLRLKPIFLKRHQKRFSFFHVAA